MPSKPTMEIERLRNQIEEAAMRTEERLQRSIESLERSRDFAARADKIIEAARGSIDRHEKREKLRGRKEKPRR